MSTDIDVENDTPKKPEKALIPVASAQTKSLVLGVIRSAFADTGQSIGVSTNWLTKHVAQLMLTEQEVDILVMIRTEFRGLLPHAV